MTPITRYAAEGFTPTQPYHVRVFINGRDVVWPPATPDGVTRSAAERLARRLRSEYPEALVRIDATRYVVQS